MPSKSRKRNHAESNEFMPLSKSKLFESDDENCEYDWGFKKTEKTANRNEYVKVDKNTDEINEKTDNIGRKFAYKFTNPINLNDDDREIYMSNLTKIYNRSYVYVPSFYELDNVTHCTDTMIAAGVSAKLREELATVSDSLEQFWEPLHKHYVLTDRLPVNCSASKLISRCWDQFSRAKLVYEACVLADGNLKPHAAALKQVLQEMANKDIESIINIFKVAVGDVLLQHASDPSVLLDQMSSDSHRVVFDRMVRDDLDTVKSRVEANVKRVKKVAKATGAKRGGSDDESDVSVAAGTELEATPNEDRPASKAILDNKGLARKRKKIDSNPRVKHRMKFKKAIVKYHSQVPRSRDDVVNYSGEQSGIRIGVIKAKKIK